MPKTGMAMEEGTVVRWLKKVGETISKGEAIAVIETDKVTMDLESDYDGTLLAIVHGDGEVVKATHTIAWIGAPGEEIQAPAEATAGIAQSCRSRGRGCRALDECAPARPRRTGRCPRPRPRVHMPPSGNCPFLRRRDRARRGGPHEGPLPGRAVKATPLARKVAEINSVDLVRVGAREQAERSARLTWWPAWGSTARSARR